MQVPLSDLGVVYNRHERERRAISKGTVRPHPFDKIQIAIERNYLVKGLIPRCGLVVIYGKPKCGKRFWTHDLLMHAALGRKYRGRRVQGGAVVYCALEGAEGFRARVEAFRIKRLPEEAEFIPSYLVNTPISLIADHVELIANIRSQV